MANVGVIGAGSWGTALSVLLADNGHHVTIWSIDEKEVEMLDKKREHLTKSEESFRQHVSSEQKQKKRRNICSLRLLIKCSVYIQVRIF